MYRVTLRWVRPGVALGLGVLAGQRKRSLPHQTWCSGTLPRGPAGPSWESADVAVCLERNYLNPEVVLQRKRILETLAPKLGESVLDVGCGPALLLADVAKAVGPTGRAEGIDPSEAMLALGRKRLGPITQANLQIGGAENLPFPDATFDAVVFTQVLCYVQDVPAALQEVRRVLRPGGRVLVLDTDWQGFVINAVDKEQARRVLQSHEQHFLDSTLPRKLPQLLRDAGFQLCEVSGVPMLAAGTVDVDKSFVGQAVFKHMPKNALLHPPSQHVPGDADGFVAEQQQLNRNGEFFAAVNRYIFLATI